jgi:uncharacterized protein YoxC
MSESASLTLIAICQLVLTIAVLAVAIGLLYAVFQLKRTVAEKLDQVTGQIRPISEKAHAITEQVQSTVDKAAGKVDTMMTAAEDAVVGITDAIRNVSRKVEESFSPRVATIAALAVSIAKCLRIWREGTGTKDTSTNSSSCKQE